MTSSCQMCCKRQKERKGIIALQHHDYRLFYFVVSEAVTKKEPQCNYYFLQVKGEPPNLNSIFNSQALLEKLYMNQVKIILIISCLVPSVHRLSETSCFSSSSFRKTSSKWLLHIKKDPLPLRSYGVKSRKRKQSGFTLHWLHSWRL